MAKVNDGKRRTKQADTEPLCSWFRSSDEVYTGFASGSHFEMKPVKYSPVGGMAIFEGDIALGTVEEMEEIAGAVADPSGLRLSGAIVSDGRFRWPGALIPYTIDPGLSDPERVTNAMAVWSTNTPLRFVPRDPANPDHQNYVSFEELDGCWSQVGMRGGKQIVSLGPTCTLGSAIHEIGHVAGLWHEQSREDRDQNIRILWDNILEGREHNFDQHVADGDDIGPYDFNSIMHYPALAFSRNGLPTIVTIGGEPIGQRIQPSGLDFAAVNAMYAAPPAPPEKPPAPSPIASRPGPTGSETLGSIPPLDTRRWITSDWPVAWQVHWTVVPSPAGTRVETTVITERQSGDFLRYYIGVRNLSESTVTIDARFAVVGA
jgi:hypothetical protein